MTDSDKQQNNGIHHKHSTDHIYQTVTIPGTHRYTEGVSLCERERELERETGGGGGGGQADRERDTGRQTTKLNPLHSIEKFQSYCYQFHC